VRAAKRAPACLQDVKIISSFISNSNKRVNALESSEQIEQAAKVCHEALRAYCQTLGDNSLPPWDDAPEWQKESSRDGVRFQFAQAAAGITPSPSATHAQWLKQKRSEGWKQGVAKDHQTKEHPAFVAYEDLSLEEKRKDYLFAAVCKAFSQSDAEEGRKPSPSK
jgi:hypothetical protein